ncbi:MAG: hypothetical protein ACXVFL_05820, partial [Solirubrobacteraceae bacterium]
PGRLAQRRGVAAGQELLLRRKALIAGRRLPGDGGIGREAALAHAGDTWRAAAPLTAWLDEHVGPSALPPPVRGRRR